MDFPYRPFVKLFFQKYGNILKYTDVFYPIKCRKWFQFDGHRWRLEDNNKIITRIYFLVRKLVRIYYEEFLNKTKNNIIRNKIVIKIKKFFYDPNFIYKLDSNKNLICFKNGIFDLRRNILRKSKLNDFVSMCTNIYYTPYYKNDIKASELNDYLERILPEMADRLKLFEILMKCIDGSGNGSIKMIDKYPPLFKTTANFMSLLLFAFGDYFIHRSIECISKLDAFQVNKYRIISADIVVSSVDLLTYNSRILQNNIFIKEIAKDNILFVLDNSFNDMDNSIFFTKYPEENWYPLKYTRKMKEWNEIFMAMLIDMYAKKRLNCTLMDLCIDCIIKNNIDYNSKILSIDLMEKIHQVRMYITKN